MYQIDHPTASTTLPASTAVGTAGFFTDGNPGTGLAPTVVPAEFLNMLMLELINAITGAGLALSKNGFTQLQQAVKRYAQSTPILSDTGGAANSYSAVNADPLAPDIVTGVTQRIVIGHSNAGPSTYAPDGLAAKPIYGLGLQPLQGGELLMGSIATLVYLGSANAGAGAWILTHCAGGALQIAPAVASRHALTKGQADALYAPLGGSGMIGESFSWPMASNPSYGILCNGAAVSSTVYSALFAKMVRYKVGATISIASTGVVSWAGHGLLANGPVKFSTTGTLPTGLVAGTTYYVMAAGLTADAFQLSATVGGAAIATTGGQLGVHTAINAPWGCANDLSTFNVPNAPPDYAVVQAAGNEGTTTVGQVIGHSHTTFRTAGSGVAPGSNIAPAEADGLGVTGFTGGSANFAAGVRMRIYIRFA